MRRGPNYRALFASLCLALSLWVARAEAAPPLRVSADKRSLVRADGTPFFWLGDTAWQLFHRLNRAETERYLRDRAGKGFTVIQVVALSDLEGPASRNVFGQPSLDDRDPLRPNEAYFAHVDWAIQRANALGLTVGLLPSWGDAWNPQEGDPPAIFDVAKARAYCEALARRYKDADLIWILGGDRRVESDQHRAIIRAMAEGLRTGDGGTHLITFHPSGANGSSTWFHDEPWLDFNMRQNGHDDAYTQYARTLEDYRRTPIKPVVDGEPLYEDHPLDFKQGDHGHASSSDARRTAYWDLFGGAFGHTFGNHAIWQFWAPPREPINDPLMPWTEALAQPGAAQMQHARKLLESRPGAREPDDALLVTDRVATSVPGRGRYRFVAQRASDASWAMVYAPLARRFAVKLDAVKATRVKAWWFDPRTGKARAIGIYPARGERTFAPPDLGEARDWVLVLDDADKGFVAPGLRAPQR